MPLREFGGRAAGGALGLQHGNVATDALGNIAVVFAVPFGAVPDIVANVLDAALNYAIVIRTVNALGFTAHVRQLVAQAAVTGTDLNRWARTAVAGTKDCYESLGIGQPGGDRHFYSNVLTANKAVDSRHVHDHTVTVGGDQAAGAGVTVMWMAVA